jgi:hypothetical protein
MLTSHSAPRSPNRLRRVAALAAAAAALIAVAATAPAAFAAPRTWYVAPSGSDAGCASNSSTAPFATIQAAVQCAAGKDVIALAPSGSTPYPGIGPVEKNIVIEAAPGADARTVTVDLGQPTGPDGFSAGQLSVAAGKSVRVQGVAFECTRVCIGSLLTNNGTLTLTGVEVSGAQNGAAINDASTGATPAVLTVVNSTIAHNSNSGVTGDSNAGGISVAPPGHGPAPVVTVRNSTITDNSASFGEAAGAISAYGGAAGEVTLTNDTITGNSGPGTGGIYAAGGASAPVVASNTILAGNTAMGGGPFSGPDCIGTIDNGAGGHNLLGDTTNCSGMTNGVHGDLVGVPDLGLNALADNGGSTDTMSLQPQSLAIGTGDAATCQAAPLSGKDERGVARKTAKRGCDIGAYDTAGTGGVAGHTWYVAPNGTASDCPSNSKQSPFATVQAAVACASEGDAIVLAPTGSRPYPGIGAVAKSVTIEAAPGSTARSVVVELSSPADSSGFSTGLVSIASSASVKVQNVGLRCTEAAGHLCLNPGAGSGSLVTNNGALSLTNVSLTGGKHGAAINDVSTGTAPARLVVTGSTISGNSNDDVMGDAHAAGISASFRGPSPDPQMVISNSTIDGNAGQSDAGGLYVIARSITVPAVTLVGDTITGNSGDSDAGGVASPSSLMVVSNTVIAANTSDFPGAVATDCEGRLADGPGGHNLIGDGSGCTALANGMNGDHVGTAASPIDPKLGPLAYNGGATQTPALLTDSPLLSGADAATCTAWPIFGVDQRGKPRNAASRGACDVGAYDTGGTAP